MGGVIVPAMHQKEDALTTVLKGLQIAQSVYGIKANMDRADAAEKADQESAQTRKDNQRGLLTPSESLELSKTHDMSETAAPGAQKVFIRTPEGGETPMFASVRKKTEAPKNLVGITVPGANGKPVQKFVPKEEGSEYQVYREPKSAKLPKDISVQERNQLQGQYDRDPTTRANRLVASSYEDARELLKDPSPASDQALIVAYVKAFDPTSVVKESEAETAAAMGSLTERAKAKYNALAGAGRLTDEQRKDLFNQIEKKAKTAASRQAEIDKQFMGLASRREVAKEDLRFAIPPSFEEKTDPPSLSAPKVGTEVDGYVFQGGDPSDQKNWVLPRR